MHIQNIMTGIQNGKIELVLLTTVNHKPTRISIAWPEKLSWLENAYSDPLFSVGNLDP